MTPQVSEHFPRVPKGCETVSETFFKCFYEHGKQAKDTPDADIGNRALETCSKSLEAYNACVDSAATKAPKQAVRAPEAYRKRS